MTSPPPRVLRLHPGLLAAAVILLGLLWWAFARSPEPPQSNEFDAWNMPVPVRTVVAQLENLSVQLKAIGTVTPLNTVTVRSRVDGELASVLFTEGEQVEAGQLLAQIDPQPYRVRLAQAEGQQQQNVAQLENAERELARYQQLIERNTIALQDLDRQRALVSQLRGTLKSDQAQVDDAQLQLQYTRITAPIGGRLGLRRIDAGNLVSSTDSTGLVTITQTRPITVVFTIPESDLPQVRAQFDPAAPLPVEVWDRADRLRLAVGRLTTFDNQIDSTTGTVRLKAEFENGDDALFPNQFVNVRLHVSTLANAVTIPVDAAQFGTRGTYVYSIRDGLAFIRPISLGPTVDGRIAVSDGLAAGDRVVIEGLDRLREGREVVLVDDPVSASPGTRESRGS